MSRQAKRSYESNQDNEIEDRFNIKNSRTLKYDDSSMTILPGQYSAVAQKLMSRMGHVPGRGLGLAAQGIAEPLSMTKQRGRRGLGMIIKGLEEEKVIWNPSNELIIIQEKVKYLPKCNFSIPDKNKLESWLKLGPRKSVIKDENHFCDPHVLLKILECKSIFDQLEDNELRKARTRSNPFETIRGGIFQNRAAMKMANLDAVFNFMFTNPCQNIGSPMVNSNEIFYFADVCSGPGGFSEYILWKKKWQSKGFGFTLKGSCDFKLENFFAGPVECFETHYGVGGLDGDGNIFNEGNINAFEEYVIEKTNGKGVHLMMADGGFSVEGKENIQEILSKQLYLCQFIVALGIVRFEGNFVCKLFDIFTPFSVGLIYLMYLSFEKVSIHKPNTSRPANSERYLICNGKKSDVAPIYSYMKSINRNLIKLGIDGLGNLNSNIDVIEVVPMEIIKKNKDFLEYIKESNNSLGKLQIIGLSKIAAFCKNFDLKEDRQGSIRVDCLKFWQIPDETRKAPPPEDPLSKTRRLLNNDLSFLSKETKSIQINDIKSIFKCLFDWKFILHGSNGNETCNPTFIIGLGTTNNFRYNAKSYNKWEKISQSYRFELPADSLIYAEIVTEIRGENQSSRRIPSLHIIDAAFIGGQDIRHLDLISRNEKVKLLVKAITKDTRKDLIKVRSKEIYDFHKFKTVFESFKYRNYKGQSKPRLCTDVESNSNSHYFAPCAVTFYRIALDPYTIALSKTYNQKYWFNTKENKSAFECPIEAVVNFKNSYFSRVFWKWDKELFYDSSFKKILLDSL